MPHVLLGNPDGVDPDSHAHSVSSRRGVPTPCTRRRSPLRSIAQSTWGRIPCADISHPEFRASTFHIQNSVRRHFTSEILCFNILHPDISQPDGRGGRFNFSGQTYPDPLIALTRRVFLSVYNATVFSWSFLIFPTDILRYFALDICCLNPQSLL